MLRKGMPFALVLTFALLPWGFASCGSLASDGAAPSGPARLMDGVYRGIGRSRPPFGTIAVFRKVEVELRIADGRIVGVRLLRPRMLDEKLAPLGARVVERGSADVDGVSGASWSSAAYRNAVDNALSEAKGEDR